MNIFLEFQGGEATTNEMCIALMYGVPMGVRMDNIDGTKDSFVVCMTSAELLEPFKVCWFWKKMRFRMVDLRLTRWKLSVLSRKMIGRTILSTRCLTILVCKLFKAVLS